jgi:hypothetical protein
VLDVAATTQVDRGDELHRLQRGHLVEEPRDRLLDERDRVSGHVTDEPSGARP